MQYGKDWIQISKEAYLLASFGVMKHQMINIFHKSKLLLDK